jgi:hypothetical protein
MQSTETMEHMDSESQLKSSKRETAKNKFFKPNPPRKGKDTLSKSLVFSKKDQKKIAKNNSAFFGNNKLNIDEKEKKENFFQKDYKTIYNPKFKGPKIISQNLGFYSKDDDEFEQEKDNDNINPPYFGKGFKRIKEVKSKKK